MADGKITELKEVARNAKPQARISEEFVRRSRVKPTPMNPFIVPSFPPVVEQALKTNNIPTLAQDQVVAGTLGWAAQDVIYSAFAEGVCFLGYSYLSTLAQRAEYRVVTETIAGEMVREWVELKVASGDDTKTDRKKKIEDRLEELECREAFRKCVVSDGFFGRGHLYMDTGCTDDSDELVTDLGNGRDVMSKLKIGPDRPQKLIRLHPVEATWAYPTHYESVDPLKKDWYAPVTWYVMSRQIHRSRFLTFIMREVPDILKPAYAFGGLSMSQMLKPYVDNWIRTRQSVSDIIQNFSFNVLRTNMDSTTSVGGDNVLGRVAVFNNIRTNQGTIVIDKDSEDWSNVSVPLGGLDHLQAQSQEHLASVSRIPLVKLLGIQPAGLNASSEGELLSFEDWIAAAQEFLFRIKFQTVLDFVQLSLFGDIDDDIQFIFKPLRQLKPIEEAQLQQIKGQTREGYFQIGAVDANEVRESLAQDPDTPFDGLDLSKPMENPPGMGMPGMPGGGGPGGQPPPRPKPGMPPTMSPGGTPGGGGPAPPKPHISGGDTGPIHSPFPFNLGIDARPQFSEEAHKRRPKGKGGGQFVKKGEGGGGGTEKPAAPETKKAEPAAPKAQGGEQPPPPPTTAENVASSLYRTRRDPTMNTAKVMASLPPEIQNALHEADQKLAQGVPTAKLYQSPDGTWTPERQALHRKIISNIFTPERIAAATPREGQKPLFTMLGGRGGSGKSWLTQPGGPVDKEHAIYLNSDDLKEALPEYQGWNAALLHQEATHIFNMAGVLARQHGLSVIHDETMRQPRGHADKYKDAGYDLEGHYMFLPPEKAAVRAAYRFTDPPEKGGGRYVPPHVVMANTENEANFDALKPQYRRWSIYDNDVPRGSQPRYVASSPSMRQPAPVKQAA